MACTDLPGVPSDYPSQILRGALVRRSVRELTDGNWNRALYADRLLAKVTVIQVWSDWAPSGPRTAWARHMVQAADCWTRGEGRRCGTHVAFFHAYDAGILRIIRRHMRPHVVARCGASP